jgi:uncharacterized damage-inducible protein DinB
MRPTVGEYAEYFERYISLVTEPDVLAVLNAQASTVHDALSGLSDGRAAHRYAEGKWSVREVLGHVVDCERVFGFRALAIARGEPHPLPSFDEDAYAAAAAHDRVPIDELAEEFATLRRSHVLMLKHLDDAGRTRLGVVNTAPTSVSALAFIMAGHVRHHARLLTDRYGVAVRA